MGNPASPTANSTSQNLRYNGTLHRGKYHGACDSGRLADPFLVRVNSQAEGPLCKGHLLQSHIQRHHSEQTPVGLGAFQYTTMTCRRFCSLGLHDTCQRYGIRIRLMLRIQSRQVWLGLLVFRFLFSVTGIWGGGTALSVYEHLAFRDFMVE